MPRTRPAPRPPWTSTGIRLERWQGGLTEVLPAVDILFANAAEAAGVSGAGDPTVAATVLAARGPLPVVKLGPGGALAHDGCHIVHVAAPAVDVVDTVGAGDSLDAGFLCGRLSGWDVGRSLALGVACGSLSTRAAGGVVAQPWRAQAETAMAGLLPVGDDAGGAASDPARVLGLHALTGILDANRRGERRGVTSVCSANPFVLEAAAARAARRKSLLCVESTASQVNPAGWLHWIDADGLPPPAVRTAASTAGSPPSSSCWAAITSAPSRGGSSLPARRWPRLPGSSGTACWPATRSCTSTPV